MQDGTVNEQNPSALVHSSLLTRLLLAPNPGPMSLEGTNSYVIGLEAADACVVVDPGPLDEAHLAQLAAAGNVELLTWPNLPLPETLSWS
jgi:glyoxylase-like metal-dependent hydrolase (beta-lactamase superfamily II)